MEITKKTKVGDVIDLDRETAQFFFKVGMHCVGCPASRAETIEQACLVHGADCDKLVSEINDYFAKKDA